MSSALSTTLRLEAASIELAAEIARIGLGERIGGADGEASF